jgi:hypothetical protein
MKARHLPTHESLLIINPKEIVLSKIIGEVTTITTIHNQTQNSIALAIATNMFVTLSITLILEPHPNNAYPDPIF